ncbi:MAG: hydantoinase/oxoprolinase family protein [Xanthomonadales bacterium]|nr:hydantoinase/oxoprolinase family protein [Xanthomonadales bacterium]
MSTPDLPVVGVDTGGTFTDFYLPTATEICTLKVLSTPDDPGRAIVQGLRQLGLVDRPCVIIHGTTVGTNAVLEGKGARVHYVSSQGFGDVLKLGRQQRQQVYALHPEARANPVAAEDCLEINARLDAQGAWLTAPNDAELAHLAQQLASAEAVAINLIHGWCAPEAEALLAQQAPAHAYVAMSHAVLPEAGEYERGIATWLQASTGPVLSRYLDKLHATLAQADLRVMQSDGLTLAAAQAAERAVRLLLSGPAGGTAAAADLAQRYGIEQLLTFDMGGTSSDVALVEGQPVLTQEASMGPWPVAVPMVDIHTIGAGGGSLVSVDSGGLMQVGPESAGAMPGPACYGRGGQRATVTDAHVVLGRIPKHVALAGDLPLDREAAMAAVQSVADAMGLSLEAAAEGVIRLANEQMSRALRVVSADRGRNPADCVLLSFGGAGGLHACELADLLGIQQVMVAPHAGVLSAMGMTVAQPGRRQVRSVLELLTAVDKHKLSTDFSTLSTQSSQELMAEGVNEADIQHHHVLGLRYQGQKSVLAVNWQGQALVECEAEFTALHQARYGYTLARGVELAEIEVMSQVDTGREAKQRQVPPTNVWPIASCEGETEVWQQSLSPCAYYRREALNQKSLSGPAIVIGVDTTLFIPEQWQGAQDEHGVLMLQRKR